MKENQRRSNPGGCLGWFLILILCVGLAVWIGSGRGDFLLGIEPGTADVGTGLPAATEHETETGNMAAGTDETVTETSEPVAETWPKTFVPQYYPELDEIELPISFARRQEAAVPPVKDQGELGTCWAFACLMALESALEADDYIDFSEDHLSNNQNFQLQQDDGGEYTMALAYLLSWQGPVPEELDPYGDGYSPADLAAVKHIQEVQFLPKKNYHAIKTAVYLRGGVQSSLYTQLKNAESESPYYERENYAYCYDGTDVPNHEVVIVGWDDEFPREAFSIDVPGDGAFLCVNSWGTNFGDEGYFYVSYYDTNIGVHNVLYTGIEAAENYDYIYQSDLCGWIGTLGYGEEEAWAANVYQAGQREQLAAAGFYAVGAQTRFELYVLPDAAETPDFSKRKLVAAGRVTNPGYYTIPVTDMVVLEPDERFAVIIRVITPGVVHPIAIEYDAGDGKSRIDLSDGEGYISQDGDYWKSSEESHDCNICLKAYTNVR